MPAASAVLAAPGQKHLLKGLDLSHPRALDAIASYAQRVDERGDHARMGDQDTVLTPLLQRVDQRVGPFSALPVVHTEETAQP